jgi:hypothetical protein
LYELSGSEEWLHLQYGSEEWLGLVIESKWTVNSVWTFSTMPMGSEEYPKSQRDQESSGSEEWLGLIVE